jgi:hypothetical protein
MDKNQYYQKSKELGMQLRCPILDRCSRRAMTIYYFSFSEVTKPNNVNYKDFLISKGQLDEDFNEKAIDLQGESPQIISGNSSYFFSDVCPEVNLFDKAHGIGIANGIACISGSWDKYNLEPKDRIHECRHYSECPEFNKFEYDRKNIPKDKKLTSSTIVSIIRELIAENKLEEAAKQALDYSIEKELESEMMNCLNILRRIKEIQKEEVNGTLSHDDLTLKRNQVTNSLLIVTKELEKSQ